MYFCSSWTCCCFLGFNLLPHNAMVSVPWDSSSLDALLTAFHVSWGSNFCLQFPLLKSSASRSALNFSELTVGLMDRLLLPESSSAWPWSAFLPSSSQPCYFKLTSKPSSFPLPISFTLCNQPVLLLHREMDYKRRGDISFFNSNRLITIFYSFKIFSSTSEENMSILLKTNSNLRSWSHSQRVSSCQL